MTIPQALRGVGVKWIKTVDSYDIAEHARHAARGAHHARARAQGHHRARASASSSASGASSPLDAQAGGGRRRRSCSRASASIPDVCTGDHSCMRLNGCPSLTLRESPDPLREDPIAHVDETCVGCGVCGEVAHAAVLCPSFYEVHVVTQSRAVDALARRARAAGRDRRASPPARERRPASLSRPRFPPSAGRAAACSRSGSWRRRRSTAIRVHGTSIPGVAQRTGSTTYYVELCHRRATATPGLLALPRARRARRAAGARVPRGRADDRAGLRVAGAHDGHRAARTASTRSTRRSRPAGPSIRASGCSARRARARAPARAPSTRSPLAREHGTEVNAVLLGALAGSGVLPIATTAFRQGDRAQGRRGGREPPGFELGLELGRRAARRHGRGRRARRGAQSPGAVAATSVPRRRGAAGRRRARSSARRCTRLVDYQDARYARRYLERLAAVRRRRTRRRSAGAAWRGIWRCG